MPDPGLPLDRRHLQQPIIDALAELRASIDGLNALHGTVHAIQATMAEMAGHVEQLRTWQKEQAEEDRVRRDAEQRSRLRAEWEAEQTAQHRRRVESWRKIGRSVGALIAAADAIGLWEVVSSYEHGLHWTLQTIAALALALIAIVLLIL